MCAHALPSQAALANKTAGGESLSVHCSRFLALECLELGKLLEPRTWSVHFWPILTLATPRSEPPLRVARAADLIRSVKCSAEVLLPSPSACCGELHWTTLAVEALILCEGLGALLTFGWANWCIDHCWACMFIFNHHKSLWAMVQKDFITFAKR